MSRYENRQELADKIDWEGGLYDMLFGYGLSRHDLPKDDAELLAAFDDVQALIDDVSGKIGRFEALLPEPSGE